MDRTHGDLNSRCRAIIDDAIAELLMLGMASRDAAASLMAIQSIIRIEEATALKTVADFAASMIEDDE